MLGTSRRLLSSLTLFTFVWAFAIPSLVLIESAKASPNVIFVRDHTTYYVCVLRLSVSERCRLDDC